jgi:hypothetical protein
VTTPGAGVYDSSSFTWSTGASTPLGYSFTVVDQAGNSTTQSLSLVSDVTAPTSTFALGPDPVGVLLSGTTLYYRASVPGSFTLVDTVTDAGSGPASATFPATATSGWTHNAETVTSGSGSAPTIAYGSSPYSWTATPGAPPSGARTITSADRVGNEAQTTLTFTVDTTGPTGGALTVNGTAATTAGSTSASGDGSFSIARTDYNADAGAGFATSVLTREASALAGSGCGAFGSATTIAGAPAQTGLVDGCYRYTLTGTDRLGNTSSVVTTVRVETVPVVTLTAVTDGGGHRERFHGTTNDLSGTITIQVRWGSTVAQTYTFAATSSPWTYETEIWDLIVGFTYSARVRQTDADGNTSDWSDPFTFVAF